VRPEYPVLATLPIMAACRAETEGREEWTLKITDVGTVVVETNDDRTFTLIYTSEEVAGMGERLLAPGLSQGEICHGC
jgi:hypothetical protein